MHKSLVINNSALRPLIRETYLPEQLAEIRQLLQRNGTLDFPVLSTGLFSASVVTASSEYTGYRSVWVRDNIHIAHAHYVNGKQDVAIRAVKALLSFFQKQRVRFEQIIAEPTRASTPMNRPHVRFNGETLEEIDANWAHAQNDALGYFLWLYCLMANEGAIEVGGVEAEILDRFIRYFGAIRYWEDEDSGHWEEVRKVSASSMGVVVAGLRELKRLIKRNLIAPALWTKCSLDSIDQLLDIGTRELRRILPFECIQQDPSKNRRYDSALLFLVLPLRAIAGAMANTIVLDAVNNLQGEYGIKRYQGDSFWCTDYKRVPESLRTADYSNDLGSRNSLFTAGGEAQWCLFDPIISAYFGREFQDTAETSSFRIQTAYFNRSLGQITGSDCPLGEFKCPELYYSESGRIEPSDATPLLWTQANLWLALAAMEQSAQFAQILHS
jgi:hypothetical protein